MLLEVRKRRWTGPVTAGLGVYVVAMAVLVVLLSGDVHSSRRWFFTVATLGAVVLTTLIIRVRRARTLRRGR
ncbi:MAG TPA: hypothetical protein VEJ18_15615 [Planctomycetota bacterium]|nr:hypothetical protein [Planctomycetota bacterium]